jgi:H+-translocating NAD(P) transhydrogenase subunit beta
VNVADAVAIVYLISVALFAIGLKRLARVRTSRGGNALAATGMLIAIVGTLVERGAVDLRWVPLGLGVGAVAGSVMVVRAKATHMPQIVARFNGFGGAASALVALALFWRRVVEAGETGVPAAVLGAASAVTVVISVLVGSSTFSGSVIAELKLRGLIRGMPRVPARPLLMIGLIAGGLGLGGWGLFAPPDLTAAEGLVLAMLAASLLVGVLLVVPIGGADMPVVISLLNSLSGVAAAATGFALGNNLLIIAGTIVGAAGLILTQIMCRAMNRSLAHVLAGGFGAGPSADEDHEYTNVVSADAEEVAMVLEAARSVIIVPGYGLAAARAQHAVYELSQTIEEIGATVRFAIHPVAGRMPGHMNVVLAEADVPYELLFEMDEINRDFKNTDVAIVVGANDVVNPAAREQPGSPIAGMPILNVDEAGRVIVVKRSLSPGYAGIKNPLFERDNTVMLFGDAREALHELSGELQAAAVR